MTRTTTMSSPTRRLTTVTSSADHEKVLFIYIVYTPILSHYSGCELRTFNEHAIRFCCTYPQSSKTTLHYFCTNSINYKFKRNIYRKLFKPTKKSNICCGLGVVSSCIVCPELTQAQACFSVTRITTSQYRTNKSLVRVQPHLVTFT